MEKNQMNNEGQPVTISQGVNSQIPQPNYGFQPPQPGYNFQPPPPYEPQNPPSQPQQIYAPQLGSQVVTVIHGGGFGPEPRPITCPSCHSLITTRVDYESSSKTHLMAVILCLLVWPCFWIPYAVDSCKNANHYCPSCNAYLGSYSG